MKHPKIIAYYLPQYHPFPENDEWWGKGFTEWTSVGKAKPLFHGHNQPRVPADLGYYDLRLPEVRELQSELAKEAGIYGFCYWHYWFGGGKQLLQMPFNEVLRMGKPDFPFCLGWANETWKAKVWDASSESVDRTLIEQRYLGESDYRAHFESLIPAFKDSRYIRYEEKILFLVYKPFEFSDVSLFITLWNKWIKEYGIAESFYFVANISTTSEHQKCIDLGFNAVTYNPTSRMLHDYRNKPMFVRQVFRMLQHLTKRPLKTFAYRNVMRHFFTEEERKEDVIPFLLPNWDHSPRSGRYAIILQNSTPVLFKQHVAKVFEGIKDKKNNLVFLKSWNEWGEGNYMEPDLRWGKGYIDVLREELDNL